MNGIMLIYLVRHPWTSHDHQEEEEKEEQEEKMTMFY